MAQTMKKPKKKVYHEKMPAREMEKLFERTKTKEGLSELRKEAFSNESLANLLRSEAFLLALAEINGTLTRIPPRVWIEEQTKNGHFIVDNEKHTFNYQDIVLNKVRHGFGPLDVPLEAAVGFDPIQDIGNCTSDVPLRNIFIIGNAKTPILRLDPLLFAQRWVLSAIKPKFVFKGMLACPKGDYGLVHINLDATDNGLKVTRKTTSLVFKNGEVEKTGHFIPFEVSVSDYDWRSVSVFVTIMAYHVKKSEYPLPGFRLANCTFECVLPEEIRELQEDPLEKVPLDEHDLPLRELPFLPEEFKFEPPEYLLKLRRDFHSVMENARIIRNEIDLWTIERQMESASIEDVEEMEEDKIVEKRKNGDTEDEPEVKRMR